MKLKDINGNEISVNIIPKDRSQRSKRQTLVKEILNEIYPFGQICEEFTIPGSRLSVDFYLPKLSTVVEVQGEQHHEYNSFFHGELGLKKFAKQLERDYKKLDWCKDNDISLIEIFPNDTDDEIREKLLHKNRRKNKGSS